MIKTTLSSFVKSIGFNAQNYIPKEGASFSLFRIEVLSGLTVALALVPEAIADKYNSFGKKVKLRHLTRDCHRLLSRAGQLIVDSDDDPDYGMAVDYDVKLGIFGR